MKRILSLLLAVLILLSFVGCNSNNSSSNSISNSSENTLSSESVIIDSSSDKTPSNTPTSREEDSSSPVDNRPTSSDGTSGNTTTSNSTSSDSVPSNTVTSENVSSGLTSSNVTPPPTTLLNPVKPESYHCYSALNSDEKIIYNALLAAANRMDSSWIDITVSGKVNARNISLVFYSLETDHPELFWLPSQYYVKLSANKVSFLFVGEDLDNLPESSTYLIKKSQKDSMVSKLNAEIQKIKSLVTATDPFEIELQLHDILCERITYYEDEKNDPMLWTAYGALVNGSAVCEGYARAYQLLLYEFGINNTLATGTTNGTGHMWNIVNINGANYHVDVTWDDRDDDSTPPFHAFFNLSDSQITATHSPYAEYALIKDSEFESEKVLSYNFNLPKCQDDALNYFKVKSKTFGKGEESALADFIISKGGTVEIKYIGAEPDIAQINSNLRKKNSSLSVKRKIKKASAPVLILEVEKINE